MSAHNTHADNRRTSSGRHHQRDEDAHREDFDERPSLMLTRTRSQEFSMTESIAIQESLPPERPKHLSGVGHEADELEPRWPHSIRYLVLLCAFLTSLSFGVTQVPLLYVFRLMTCDAYYKHHPSSSPPSASAWPSSQSPSLHTVNILAYAYDFSSNSNSENTPDRCSIHPIESSTALSVSLLGASTTVFGLLNLFLTGSLIKRIGVKPTLVIQVFFPALRLLVQNIGVEVWGSAGIIIIQCSQIVSIIGGPSGYLLVLNTFITEVVEYEGRTAALGRLTGAMMFGSAIGFLLGGVVAEVFGIKAPFRLTFILFMSACAYVVLFLPHIPPAPQTVEESESGKGRKSKKKGLRRFLGPLAVFAPRKFIGRDGVVRTEYGAFLLAWGVFLGILATGTFACTSLLSLSPFCLRYLILLNRVQVMAWHRACASMLIKFPSRLPSNPLTTLRNRRLCLWHQAKRLADLHVFDAAWCFLDVRISQAHFRRSDIQHQTRANDSCSAETRESLRRYC